MITLRTFDRHPIQANVLRPYTPLSRPDAKGYLDLAVKVYPEGKMSKHIDSLKPGDTLDFKGPILKTAYKPNQYEHIGMVAGGTGITPMLQVSSIVRSWSCELISHDGPQPGVMIVEALVVTPLLHALALSTR